MVKFTCVPNHWFFKLPYFKRFTAMTVYPKIYMKGKSLPSYVLDHEKVHLRQQRSRLRFWFYFLPVYLLKWVRGLFVYGFSMGAYYSIDWEREAYWLTTPGFLTLQGYPELNSNPFDVKDEKNGLM